MSKSEHPAALEDISCSRDGWKVKGDTIYGSQDGRHRATISTRSDRLISNKYMLTDCRQRADVDYEAEPNFPINETRAYELPVEVIAG